MNDLLKVSGMILSASAVGENDKRVVMETCELGKISAFVRGGRRQGSSLLAASQPFAMGEFYILPGRDSYRLNEANVTEYFRDLANAHPEIYIGFYFLDLIDYYGREGICGRDMLNLVYLALKALLREDTDKLLVRSVYELRLIAMNGEYAPDPGKTEEKLFRILNYIVNSPLAGLFSFTLSGERKAEVGKAATAAVKAAVDRPLKSRKIMELFYPDVSR